MSKWDEEFDLDDFDVKPAGKKNNKPKVKKEEEEEDFFDLEDQTASKPTKLPTINKKAQVAASMEDKKPKISKNIYDDYEQIYEEVGDAGNSKKNPQKKQIETSNYYEQLEDLTQNKPNNQSNIPKFNANASNSYQQEEEFYEEIQEVKPPARQIKKIQPKSPPKIAASPQPPKEEDDYEESFDDYGEDFEEEVKEVPKKTSTITNLKAKDKNVRDSESKEEQKKYAINSNQVFTNKNRKDTRTQPSVPKPPQKQNKLETKNASKKTIEKAPYVSQQPKNTQRSSSRKSLKSNDSRSRMGNSRVTKKYMTEFTSNKHMLLVEKTFPQTENKLSSFSIEKLTRMNEHVREMIRKFNDELNELINKNMILLKDRPLQKENKADDKIRVLREQLKSGATALQVVENEYERLKGRQGELKEQEYLLIMEKRIEEAKEQIKQTSKLIHKYQVEVNSDGKKLSKQEIQKRLAQDMHQIKTMLIQVKKEEQRQETKLDKLDKMLEELEGKNNDKDYQLSEQVDAAKEKGITLNVKQSILKKYEQMKMKVSATQNHCKSLECLHKNKSEILNHQNQQIKIAIRNLESQIKNMHHTIEHSQDESIKVIKKSQQNPKLNSQIGQNLQKILKYLEENQNNAYFDVRSEGNKSQASERPLKKSMYQNMNNKQIRKSSSKNESKPHRTEPPSDQINLMKPNFMKKKGQPSIAKDEQQDTNKLYERVWSEQQQKRKKEEERKKAEQQEMKRKQEERRKLEEQDKKKPFTLKKNRLKNEEKSVEVSPRQDKDKIEAKIAQDEVKQEKPTIGPKFTRFNRREINSEKNDLSTDKPAEKESQKKITEQIPKEEPVKQEEQAIFKPKRFNLRNRLEKKDESYIPSVETKKQAVKQQPKQVSKAVNKEQHYVPKPSFKEESFNAPIVPEIEQKPQIKTDYLDEKPVVPMRLRNRQKINNTEDTSYIPTRMTQPEKPISQKNIDSGYNPTSIKPNQQKAEDSYIPSSRKAEKEQPSSNPYAPKPYTNNPYAPTCELKPQQVSNPYVPKKAISNPYTPAVEQKPVTNPYATKEDAPKREKQGPVKKIKIQNKVPKQKFNIYEQAEDLTEPASQPINTPINEPGREKPVYNINLGNTGELNLEAMLGKEKKKPDNDYGDLLGEVKVDKKKENKKKANDFFNDLMLD